MTRYLALISGSFALALVVLELSGRGDSWWLAGFTVWMALMFGAFIDMSIRKGSN